MHFVRARALDFPLRGRWIPSDALVPPQVAASPPCIAGTATRTSQFAAHAQLAGCHWAGLSQRWGRTTTLGLGFSRPHCTEKQFSHRSPPGPSTTYNTLFTYRTAESIPCFRQYLTPTVLTTETLVTLYFYWFSALQAHITRLNSEKMKYSQPSVGTSKLGALCCALSFTTSTQRAR